jgi:hypothetical protein
MNSKLKIGVCDVDRWVGFVTRMTQAQRCKLAEADLQSLIHMKSISPRSSILSLMFKAFDAESETFNLQKDQPSITIKGVDVEEIFGLKDKAADGLDIDTILYEDGEYAENDIPSHFLNKSTGSLSIDGLISDAIKSGLADDDFLRRAVLVALGTVLAPQSSSTVPLEYWTIVKYVSRLKKMNFNGFTRSYLINNIKKLRSEHEMVQWPRGNLALLQVYFSSPRPFS